MNNTHCSECGTQYVDVLSWPRECEKCGFQKWRNPVPVVAVLQPVVRPLYNDEDEYGLVIAKRAIEPMKGHWALVGGFMEVNETAEDGAAREFLEETALTVANTPKIAFTETVGENGVQLMIMTYIDKAIPYDVFLRAEPCRENEEIGLLLPGSDIVLAFPTHSLAAARFFSGEFEWQA